mmetsp:Transcript_15527/g.31417  ORF Transcript_15527/g.31417 Transcript_15527/m.31417 type:complete len:251 (-) Transcript_15527:468-1220(-)
MACRRVDSRRGDPVQQGYPSTSNPHHHCSNAARTSVPRSPRVDPSQGERGCTQRKSMRSLDATISGWHSTLSCSECAHSDTNLPFSPCDCVTGPQIHTRPPRQVPPFCLWIPCSITMEREHLRKRAMESHEHKVPHSASATRLASPNCRFHSLDSAITWPMRMSVGDFSSASATLRERSCREAKTVRWWMVVPRSTAAAGVFGRSILRSMSFLTSSGRVPRPMYTTKVVLSSIPQARGSSPVMSEPSSRK